MTDLDKQLSTLAGIARWARETAASIVCPASARAPWLQIAETCEIAADRIAKLEKVGGAPAIESAGQGGIAEAVLQHGASVAAHS